MSSEKFVVLTFVTIILVTNCNLRTSEEANIKSVMTPTATSTVSPTSTKKIPTATYTTTIPVRPTPATHTPVPTPSSVSTEIVQITRLNDNGDFDFFRAWSFDNTKIAFASEGEIYVMNVDSTNKTFLIDGENPSWSPDSTQITFASKQDGDYEIYVINVDGANLIALTNNDIKDIFPIWSPDGKKIAFVSDRDSLDFPDGETTTEIYIMNADGTNQTRLSYTATDWPESGSSSPDWSPDSKYVIFTTFEGFGNYDIHMIKADGTDQKRLTYTDTTWDLNPKWLPDGEHIVFQSNSISGGGWQTYVMNADGSNIHPLQGSSSK